MRQNNKFQNLNEFVDFLNVDTNILVDRLTNIYITAANKAIIFRKSQILSKRKSKINPNWVNKDWLLIRSTKFKPKNYKKTNNCALKQAYVTAKKTYHRLRKTLRAQFFKSIANKKNSLNPNNSWQFGINQSLQQNNPLDYPFTSNEIRRHNNNYDLDLIKWYCFRNIVIEILLICLHIQNYEHDE